MKRATIIFKSILAIMIFLLISLTAFSQNLLADGAFSTTTSITPLGAPPVPMNTWCSWKNEATVSSFVAVVSDGVCSFSFNNTGYNTWDVQLSQYGFPLVKNEAYRLTFKVRSDAYRSFGVYIGEEGGSWTNLNAYSYYQYSTTSWETKTITFVATSVFPLHKLSFELGASNVKTYFDDIVLEKLVPSKVVLPGTFQSEVGCSYNWDANGSCTQLVKNSATGKWEGSFNIPAGCYEYKVAINGGWDINYGENGAYGGANIQLYVPTGSVVNFSYDPETHIVVATPYDRPPVTGVSLVGEFQSELGCSSDWDFYSCDKPALTFNSATGLWEGTFNLAAGCYKYVAKELTNCNYTFYGKDGVNWGNQSGTGFLLFLPSQTDVTIKYNPVTHKATSEFNADFCPPNTVVLPGNFQSELGCKQGTSPYPVDWDPACDFTRLTYDAVSKLWIGSFDIPAGNWEFKVAYNNSWAENYGLDGLQNGPNIPLELYCPTRITFKYDPATHLIQLSSAICVNKFYDANVNGIQDYNEPGLQGVAFTLSGDASATVTTDANGKASFAGLVPGSYTVTETMPVGYYATTATTKNIELAISSNMEVGNVCLGPGGLKGMGFWMSKNGRDVMMDGGSMEPELQSLRNFNLRNEDGSDFDPVTYDQFVNWLKKANAGNMAYMLSAQLAVLYLNYEAGYLKSDSYLYTPGCGSLGGGNFSNWDKIRSQVDDALWSDGNTPAGNPQRSYQECLKNALDNANNNLSIVQPKPCTEQTIVANKENADLKVAVKVSPVVKLWPNPSGMYFNLQTAGSNEAIQFKVFDVNGSLVYTAKGASDKVYRFGENLKAGVYMVEVLQGNSRTVQKIVKQ
jgi:hypothetical protein